MPIRRILWIMIPLLLLVVIAGGGALAWLVFQERAEPIRLLILGSDTTVRLLDGDVQRVIASDAETEGYGFPAPSPDGRRLAYVANDTNGMAIVQIELSSGARTELYRSRAAIPIDLAWSPDGRYLSFLLDGGRTVHIVASDGSQPAQLVANGPPSYFAWSPDSMTLLLHLGGHMVEGGHVATYQHGADHASPVASDPGFFQAPAWAADGKHFFYVAQPQITNPEPSIEDVKADITRVSADGRETVVLAREEQADLRIVRSPSADKLAYMVRTPKGFGGLKLIDGVGSTARVLSRAEEKVTAFFWSPDGGSIAYLTHDGSYRMAGERTWHVVDISSGRVRDFETFTPSVAFGGMGLEAFFDAYIFSFSPWSPDNSRIAYGTRDGVYVLDIATGRSTRMADGVLGMWVGGS